MPVLRRLIGRRRGFGAELQLIAQNSRLLISLLGYRHIQFGLQAFTRSQISRMVRDFADVSRSQVHITQQGG